MRLILTLILILIAWVKIIHKTKQNLSWGINFVSELKNAAASNSILLNLPNTLWVPVLIFLTLLDIINLCYSSKNFAWIIFSAKPKLLFDPMDTVCNLKTWNHILSKHFSVF